MNLMINLLFRLTLPKIIYRNILSKFNINSFVFYNYFVKILMVGQLFKLCHHFVTMMTHYNNNRGKSGLLMKNLKFRNMKVD